MKEEDGDDREEYRVGYGKPPLGSRFRHGVSGNPKGRPRGIRNFQTELSEELRTKVTVHENGRRKKITKRQAIAKQLVNKAASGDLKAIPTLFSQSRELIAEQEQLAAVFDTPDDKAVLEGLLERLRGANANPKDSED